jgi:hypothetical protein
MHNYVIYRIGILTAFNILQVKTRFKEIQLINHNANKNFRKCFVAHILKLRLHTTINRALSNVNDDCCQLTISLISLTV